MIFSRRSADSQAKDDRLIDASIGLLGQILQILAPLPFYRSTLVGLVNKIISQTEPHHDSVSRLDCFSIDNAERQLNHALQSDNRSRIHAALQLASAAINLDPPQDSTSSHPSGGRLAAKVWACLVEGGAAKSLGRLMGMRRRNKEGVPEYGEKDPLDFPGEPAEARHNTDIRHPTHGATPRSTCLVDACFPVALEADYKATVQPHAD